MGYGLELGSKVREVVCDCCGQIKNRVWGFVAKDGVAHAVYFALLNTDEPAPRVGLTLSVGHWADEKDADGRNWIQVEIVRELAEVKMKLADPAESSLFPWEPGGTPLGREEAVLGGAIDEFWAVADFIITEDPALVSYLISEPVDTKGREFVAVRQ
jgi:hypothetical protein